MLAAQLGPLMGCGVAPPAASPHTHSAHHRTPPATHGAALALWGPNSPPAAHPPLARRLAAS